MVKKLDIEEIVKKRNSNESVEHYAIKQAARYWVFSQGAKVVGTEVKGLRSYKDEDRALPRKGRWIKLKGVRLERFKEGKCGLCKNPVKKLDRSFYEEEELNDKYCYECHQLYREIDGVWYRQRNDRKRTGAHDIIDVVGVEIKNEYSKVGGEYRKRIVYNMRGVEVKASYQDFRNGFCTVPDYMYVAAPKGVVPKDKVPTNIGLLEIDMDELEIIVSPKVAVSGLEVTKRCTKNMAAKFDDEEEHRRFCSGLVYGIARANTNEILFKNGFGR